MGRKTKLTPAIQAQIVQMVKQGMHGQRAAEACGISGSSFYEWMRRGEAAKSGRFRDFWSAMKKADAEAEILVIGRIQLASQSGTWQAGAWIAERRWRDRWGRHVKLEFDITQATDEQLERLANGEHPASVLADTSKG